VSGIYGLCGKRDFRRDDMPAVIVPVSLCIAYQCVCGIQRWCVKRVSGVTTNCRPLYIYHTGAGPVRRSPFFRSHTEILRGWVGAVH
jgi:hypothetical protein